MGRTDMHGERTLILDFLPTDRAEKDARGRRRAAAALIEAVLDGLVDVSVRRHQSSSAIRCATSVMAFWSSPPSGPSSVVKRFLPSSKSLSANHLSFQSQDAR